MIDNDNSTKGTKEALAYKLANGFIKQCGQCKKKWIGQEFPFCGECATRQRDEALALQNSVRLYRKRDGGRKSELSVEGRANIVRANRERANK